MADGAPPDPQRVQRAFTLACARLVSPRGDDFDPRTAAVLASVGALSVRSRPDEVKSLLERLARDIPDQLENGLTGPLLLLRPEGDENGMVLTIQQLLCDPSLELRTAAMDYLTTLAGREGVLGTVTSRLVANSTSVLLSENDGARGRCIVRLCDALDADWLFNLAGVRQAAAMELSDLWNSFLRRVLRPDGLAIQANSPHVFCATLHGTAFTQRATALTARTDPIATIADIYLRELGHLPCAGDRSLARVLRSRLTGPRAGEAAEQLWNWVDENGTVLAAYHACQASLAVEGALPASVLPRMSAFLCEALEIAGPSTRWSLFHAYARYFARHVELRLPTDESDAVVSMAWWMTARLAPETSGPEPQMQDFFKHFENAYESPLGIAWELTGLALKPSLLRHLTLFGPSPWRLGLLAELGRSQHCSAILGHDSGLLLREGIGAITATAMLSKPLPVVEESPVFTFDQPLSSLLNTCADHVDDEAYKNALREWSEPILWSADDPVGELLTQLHEQPSETRTWFSEMFRIRCQLGLLPHEPVWKTLTSEGWRTTTLPALDEQSLQAVGRGVLELAKATRPDWAVELPHFFANLAEQVYVDEPRRQVCIMNALLAASALRTPSVLRRLQRGPCRELFADAATRVQEHLDAIIPLSGRWSGGRLREILVALGPVPF